MKTELQKFENIDKLHSKALRVSQCASGLIEQLKDAFKEIDLTQLTHKGIDKIISIDRGLEYSIQESNSIIRILQDINEEIEKFNR